MILRILTTGQYEVDEATVDALNNIDDQLVGAIESGDEDGFRSALKTIHELVVEKGTQLPDDYLGASELVLPDIDASIEEVKALLDDEGLIPD